MAAPNDKKKVTKAKAPRATKPTAKTIRNLRNMPVHLRLSGQSEKDYRIQLEPRGKPGDMAEVPAACTESTAFVRGAGVLFEIITRTESKNVDYGRRGYQGSSVKIENVSDSSITVATVDEKGKITPTRDKLGRNLVQTVDVVGSDPRITAHLNDPAADKLLSKGVMAPIPSVVKVEKA